MKSVTVTVTVSAQWRERPWGRWPHRELIPQMCSIKERSVFPEGRKVSRALDVSEREVNVCVFWSQMTHLHRSVSLSKMRWVRLLTHSHLSLFPLLFLFMRRLASDRGVLGDWCQWRWLLLLGLWQMSSVNLPYLITTGMCMCVCLSREECPLGSIIHDISPPSASLWHRTSLSLSKRIKSASLLAKLLI